MAGQSRVSGGVPGQLPAVLRGVFQLRRERGGCQGRHPASKRSPTWPSGCFPTTANRDLSPSPAACSITRASRPMSPRGTSATATAGTSNPLARSGSACLAGRSISSTWPMGSAIGSADGRTPRETRPGESGSGGCPISGWNDEWPEDRPHERAAAARTVQGWVGALLFISSSALWSPTCLGMVRDPSPVWRNGGSPISLDECHYAL